MAATLQAVKDAEIALEKAKDSATQSRERLQQCRLRVRKGANRTEG